LHLGALLLVPQLIVQVPPQEPPQELRRRPDPACPDSVLPVTALGPSRANPMLITVCLAPILSRTGLNDGSAIATGGHAGGALLESTVMTDHRARHCHD
jgi:hypothetical protein